MLVDDKFQCNAELGVKMPGGCAPQHPFTARDRENDSICEVGFGLQRNGSTIDEAIPALERRAVGKMTVSPVHRLIAGHGRASQIEKEGLRGIGEELVIISVKRALGENSVRETYRYLKKRYI